MLAEVGGMVEYGLAISKSALRTTLGSLPDGLVWAVLVIGVCLVLGGLLRRSGASGVCILLGLGAVLAFVLLARQNGLI